MNTEPESDDRILRAVQVKAPPFSSLPKSDVNYWRHRIYHSSFTNRRGELVRSPYYAVSLCLRGVRKNLSLGTADPDEAAVLAHKLWTDLKAGDWAKALANLRPLDATLTLGEFIAEVSKVLPKTPTSAGYVRALRLLASEAMGIERKQADSIRLSDLTRERIESWRRSKIDRGYSRVTTNTQLRACKVLFGKLRNGRFKNPFAEIGLEKVVRAKYQPQVELAELCESALAELSSEELKVFFLALCAGLRRGEIDHLIWGCFDWKANTVQVKETQWYKPEPGSQLRPILLAPGIMERFYKLFQTHGKAQSKKREEKQNDFVVQSHHAKPGRDRGYVRYRCQFVFDRVAAWLREHGIMSPRPIEELRKIGGFVALRVGGIFATARHLRHVDATTAAVTYGDDGGAVPVELLAES